MLPLSSRRTTVSDSTESNSPKHSTDTLIPQVYDELRKLAGYRMSNERSGQTLSGTALVHEAFLRLKKEGSAPKWSSQSQFFSAAAEAMRRILIDRMRAKNRVKRGGDQERVEGMDDLIQSPVREDKLLAIDGALDALAQEDPKSADLVKMRFFVGMSLEEIAESTDVSIRTVSRQWSYAKAWLSDYLSRSL